jgi:hypothetical protein
METGIENIDDYRSRFRLRSERQRKRAAKEAHDKELLRLGREWLAIRRRMYRLGWDELSPPVQRGYVRFFVLRDDVKRTKQAGFFEALLAKINVRQYSHRKDFLVKRRRHGKKIYMPREHVLPVLESWELRKLKLTAEEVTCFSEETVYEARKHCSRVVYRFTKPWRFVLRIQPNMITKVRRKDVDLDRRKAFLDCYFSVNNHLESWLKLKGGTQKSYTWARKNPTPKKYISPFFNRSFADILSEYYPEPTLRITYKNPQPPGDFSYYRNITHPMPYKYSSPATHAAANARQRSSTTHTASYTLSSEIQNPYTSTLGPAPSLP